MTSCTQDFNEHVFRNSPNFTKSQDRKTGNKLEAKCQLILEELHVRFAT